MVMLIFFVVVLAPIQSHLVCALIAQCIHQIGIHQKKNKETCCSLSPYRLGCELADIYRCSFGVLSSRFMYFDRKIDRKM